MNIEIRNKSEAREIIRGLALCDKYALPNTADMTQIIGDLRNFIKK